MPAGAPTKYTKELVETARGYVTDYADHGHMIPSIAGLARVLDVSRETIRAWGLEESKKEFSGILGDLMAEQELKLQNGGLSGNTNSTITKLFLTKHGYSDKIEQENTGTIIVETLTLTLDDTRD